MDAPSCSPYDVMYRLIGTHEIAGPKAQPFISWGLSLCGMGDAPSDEIANCSSTLNAIGFLLGLPITRDPAARSWLGIGTIVEQAPIRGFDIVILSRGDLPQPGPEVRDAQGHVALFSEWDAVKNRVLLLGANQHDSINLSWFDAARILQIRRWWS